MTNVMDRHGHHSKIPDELHTPTKKQYGLLADVQSDVYHHNSGGSFNMMAVWNKGSVWATGKNDLYRSASNFSDIYPEMCGIHAELDIQRNNNIKGGTIYIAGYHESSGSPLANTRPCRYCATILDLEKVRWVVYYSNGVAVKAMTRELV